MMWRNTARTATAPSADEEITKVARRYRLESEATLIGVCRDEARTSFSASWCERQSYGNTPMAALPKLKEQQLPISPQ
jgi:hypothetical protein